MRRIVSIFLASLVLVGTSFQHSLACSVEIEPLRKSFRRADAVFLGEVTGIRRRENVDYDKSLVDGDITFEIIKAWKGKYHNEVTLPGNVGWICACSRPDEFKAGTKYLVFVKGQNANFCESWKAGSDYVTNMEKRLSSFWFRAFAQINPF